MRAEVAAGLPAMATSSMIILGSLSSSDRECSGSRVSIQRSPKPPTPDGGTVTLAEPPVAVSEEYRTGWRRLCSDDAPFMPHRQPAVQSFQDLHRRPGIAGAFRPCQQLEGVQLKPHRVVPGHSPAVLEAPDLFQAQFRIQRPECRLKVLRRNLEAPVESRQELLQHAVGRPDAARPGPPEFSYQPVLKGSCRSLYPPLGLG